jgi:nucleoid-associated protein YgaU
VPRLFAGDAESPGRAPQEPPPDLILADEPVGEDEPPAPAEGEPYPGDADASGDAEAPDGGGGAAEAPFTIHEVEQGDNLWKLAERYLGAGHRLEKIRELNRDVLRHGDTIRAGMEIKIPVRNADK